MLHAGEVLQDRYLIIKVVGKGGMSTVYQARDLTNQNLLAIKDVERSGREDNQVVEQSLAGEGRMLKQLTSPYLPKIYDIIENAENFMLVMDFIQGESLDKVIAREGAQSMDRVLDWGMQICEVFHYLHNQPTPIIYRDMKPANVILKPDGTLTMIDFGTARTQKVGVAMQADTICIGTEGFAAPEQFGGIGQSDARTDIFCLGATLYNMVTGHSPCDKPVGILSLERWNPALANTPIAQIIYKCTRNDPNERYQTAMELYEDLHKAMAGEFIGSGKGRSGGLGFRRMDFQKQDLKGGGLVGLVLKGRSNNFSQKEAPTAASERKDVVSNGWQRSGLAAAGHPVNEAAIQQKAAQPVGGEEQPDEVWHKLMLIGAMSAVIFLVLSVVLMVFGQATAAMVFMIIALGAATLAVVGIVMSRRFQ